MWESLLGLLGSGAESGASSGGGLFANLLGKSSGAASQIPIDQGSAPGGILGQFFSSPNTVSSQPGALPSSPVLGSAGSTGALSSSMPAPTNAPTPYNNIAPLSSTPDTGTLPYSPTNAVTPVANPSASDPSWLSDPKNKEMLVSILGQGLSSMGSNSSKQHANPLDQLNQMIAYHNSLMNARRQ